MPAPSFQPRQHPELITLLHRILQRLQADLTNTLGVAVTVQDKRFNEDVSALATLGVEGEMIAVQLSGLGGPVADALTHQVPVLSLDLWTDDRWPELTFDAASEQANGITAELKAVHGAAAVPGFWREDAAIVLSCTLTEPASAITVTTLIAYEQLVSAALVTTAAQNEAAFEDLLAALQSRGAIEQAKGALMGLVGCDAEQAWSMLRRASQEFNVKLRELAVALLEHISGRPAQQPGVAEPIAPQQSARDAARLLWTAMANEERRSGGP
ncbi:antitermination regulator [Mycobacterium sp. GA-1199]|uniref:ANTAR domain-containing protein n=1 Tax=Mycobacterium sp. GA-1199 TaxID=1772287 RepID=UPI000748F546|nr:ANTAR domain-containing protein [Mycobacterium sp. GA-1199]KUI44656.1 antitermination regulator [Mycobacterium sp. GA-1199]